MIKYFANLLLLLNLAAWAQSGNHYQININPLFDNSQVILDSTYQLNDETLTITSLKFYLSNFTFLQEDTAVFTAPNSFHLIDLSTPKSLAISIDLPDSISFNKLSFNLGIDSLTNDSGVMGGDLDPMKGMYWSWNTGYINFKLEGSSPLCNNRANTFQYHLGGYLSPYCNVQQLTFLLDNSSNHTMIIELSDFFKQLDLASEHTIMSPSEKAVALSKLIAESFTLKNAD